METVDQKLQITLDNKHIRTNEKFYHKLEYIPSQTLRAHGIVP